MNDAKEEKHASDMLPTGFDVHEAVRILGDYLRNLENAYGDISKSHSSEKRQFSSELRTLNKTTDDQQQEIERLTSELLELTNALEENESSLVSANQKVAVYEKQVKKLHRDLSELEGRFAQKENDASFYKQELSRHTQDHDSMNSTFSGLNNRIDELERRLASERHIALGHEKESRRLALALSEAQGKIGLLEKKIGEAQVKHSEELRRLADRMTVDSQHEANLLKKRVKSSVAPEMRDLEKIFNEKLSIEVASNLKALLSRLVSKLEQAGLEMKPTP